MDNCFASPADADADLARLQSGGGAASDSVGRAFRDEASFHVSDGYGPKATGFLPRREESGTADVRRTGGRKVSAYEMVDECGDGGDSFSSSRWDLGRQDSLEMFWAETGRAGSRSTLEALDAFGHGRRRELDRWS